MGTATIWLLWDHESLVGAYSTERAALDWQARLIESANGPERRIEGHICSDRCYGAQPASLDQSPVSGDM